jgi:hypothetical protein
MYWRFMRSKVFLCYYSNQFLLIRINLFYEFK